jgi:hypothetical protein
MTLELIKVLVQPVAIERNSEGQIIGERTGEAVALFTLEQLTDYVAELRRQIEQTNGKPL